MNNSKDDLKNDISTNNSADYVASLAKSALGVIPFAGSLLVEIAGNIIPNQRIDRIAKYAEALNTRLSSLKEAVVKANISNAFYSISLSSSGNVKI